MPALISLGGHCKYTPELLDMVKSMSPVIAADRGYVHCKYLELIPDHLTGDMDSIPEEYLIEAQNTGKTDIRTYSREKDQTDSEIAIDIALSEGSGSICFIGAFGERYDHMLANQITAVSLALKGIDCVLTDGTTFMYTITPKNSPFKLQLSGPASARDVVSLVPVSGDIGETVIQGLKYPLNGEKIYFGSQRAVSNTIFPEHDGKAFSEADISVSSGVALLIHTISD